MKAGNVIDIAAAIVTVALVTTVVSSAHTSQIIGSIGTAFSSSMKAAMGR